MNNEDIEQLTDLMLGDSIPKMLSIIHENKKLQQENDRLTNELNICMIERNNFLSRIEKAVEYIENTPLYETTYDYNMEEELEIQNVSDETASNKLLNILNDKE